MGWCFIYYRYNGWGGASYIIGMTYWVVFHIYYRNDGWGGASYNIGMTDGVMLHIISE